MLRVRAAQACQTSWVCSTVTLWCTYACMAYVLRRRQTTQVSTAINRNAWRTVLRDVQSKSFRLTQSALSRLFPTDSMPDIRPDELGFAAHSQDCIYLDDSADGCASLTNNMSSVSMFISSIAWITRSASCQNFTLNRVGSPGDKRRRDGKQCQWKCDFRG